MSKKLFSIIILCLLGLQSVLAQSREITGIVTSADDGLTIPGVSVIVKGTTIGTTTDFDGKYVLEVPEGENLLLFSFVGMASKEVSITSSTMNVVMESESIGMDEVMVVAYGTAKKSSFTGSAANIDSEKLGMTPVVSVDQALSGMAAGVQVSGTPGQPGASSSVRIRGIGSINSSNEPLYVIDGVAITGDDISESSTVSLSPLATLNANDIESMTVLKDAAAASLYGSRAANGVILITTKRGKKGETKFMLKTEYGISDFAVKLPELASPEEAFDYKVESYKNYLVEYDGAADNDETLSLARGVMSDYFSDYDPTRPDSDYDWDDALFRTGNVKDVQFTVSGGSEKTNFFVSLGYTGTDGVATNSDFERMTGRINLDHKASEKLKIGFSTSVSYTKQNSIPTKGWYFSNPLYATRAYLNQLTPIKDMDGNYSEVQGGSRPNLVKEQGLNKQNSTVWRNSNQGYLQIELFDGLSFRTTNSMDLYQIYGHKYWSPKSSDGESYQGYIYQSNKRRLKLSSTNVFTYATSIDEVHNINVLAGFEVEALNDQTLGADGKGLPNDYLDYLDGAATPLGVYSNKDGDRMQSFLSRVNYDYENKYYLSGSFRTDASSRLGSNNRWGNFYSVSGSWRISQEEFMSDYEFVNDWKLRASYGVNGTLPSNWVGAYGLYEFGHDYNGSPGSGYKQIANDDLQWEKNANFSIATELQLFDFLNLELEYYQRKTTDLLLQVPLSMVTGFDSYWDNVGEMTNKGLELSVQTQNYSSEDFRWSTNVVLFANRNTVDKLTDGDIDSEFPYLLREGESYRSIYMRDWAGVNPTTGHGQWYILDDNENRVDLDNDGKFDTTEDTRLADKKIVGDGEADLEGSVTNSLSYKGFDLSFMFNFKIGGDVYIEPYSSMFDDGSDINRPILKSNLDHWKNEGDISDLPKVVYSNPQHTNYNSSRRVKDGSYLRLKNVSLAYSLPSALVKKAGLGNVKFYANATNLLTFSKLDDFDPEVSARGTVMNEYNFPTLKTYTFGVQLNF